MNKLNLLIPTVALNLFAGALVAQSINYASLQDKSIFSPTDLIVNERTIVMEGDIVYPNSLPTNLLHSSNVSLINNDHPSWGDIFNSFQQIQSDIDELELEELDNEQSGTVIPPGIYNISDNFNLSGFVTLEGSDADEFIFNVEGNLEFSDFTTIITNGLNPRNITWNVAGNITAGQNSIVSGVFIANGQIDFGKYTMGPVSLFSETGNIHLSTLLNIHSPNGHSAPTGGSDDFSNCSTPSGPSLVPGVNCVPGTSSPLADPANWIKDLNYNLDAPLIEVGVNFHIMQDVTGGNNFQNNTAGDILVLTQLFDWAQSLIRRPRSPSNAITAVCGTCHIADSKIQLVLKNTEFYQSNSLNTSIIGGLQSAITARDPEMMKDLNIFWTQGTYGSASGHASRPNDVNGSTNEQFLFVVMLSQYSGGNIYNPSAMYQGNYGTAVTMGHEVGHTFDLAHTYAGGGAGAVCNVNDVDYLEDVHGPAGSQNCPHNPSPSLWGCVTGGTPECTNNLMGGNYNASYSSPLQIGQMHTALRTKSMRQKITNCPFSITPLEVTTSQTWDKDIFLFRDVRVKGNSVLTITCKVGMPELGKIVIEEGSKLIIDGGHITNSCKEKFWGSIVIEGNNNATQLPLTQPTSQGKLVIKNGAIIENVMYAVTFGDGGWNNFGGLVEAEDATFRVVRRAVEFMSYPHNNNSYFKRCTFEYASGVTDTPLSLVTLWDNKGAEFSGCSFEDNTGINDYYQYVANGIFSIDAAYTVKSDCDLASPPSPCPVANFTRSTFKNLNQGVYATGAATGSKTVSIEGVEFEDNSMAIRIDALDNVSFIKNTLNQGGALKNSYPSSFLHGISIENATGYEIEQNIFNKTGTVGVIGLRIKESGDAHNEVYNNTFNGNNYEQMLLDQNKHPLVNFQGLELLCNTHTSSDPTTEILISSNFSAPQASFLHGIRVFQGSASSSTGNTFTGSGSHVTNSGGPIDYYYLGANQDPGGSVNRIAASSSNGCATRHLLRAPSGIQLAPNMIADYYTDLGNYEALLYNYYQNIDGGNTEALVANINTTFPSQAQDLRDELMESAPYLSHEAIMSAAETGILTDALLLEICLANPDATKSEGLLDFLQYEIPNTLPASMIQLIYQNWDVETPRTILELQLADLNAQIGRASSQILTYYSLDTLDHTDSIESMLKSRKTLRSEYQQVELAIENEKSAKALDILNEIPEQFQLTDEEQSEHTNFVNYANFRASILSEDMSYMQLTESKLVELRAIADAGSFRSASLAQNILCFGYEECSEESTPSERSKQRRVYNFESMTSEVNSTWNVELTPNPARDFVFVGIEDVDIDEVISFDITNAEGKVQFSNERLGADRKIDLSKLSNGIYFVTFRRLDNTTNSQKLIIQ